MQNILILGGGFGGLVMAEHLAASLDSSHQITLVSPNSKFTFYPGLVQLALGVCEPNDLTFDLNSKMMDLGVRFVRGEAVGVNPSRQTVRVTGKDFDGEIHYDYLVTAVGRRLATEKVRGFFEYAHHLLGVTAALDFGEALRNFRSGTIILGMCPGARLPVPVCEMAFALAKKFEAEMKKGEIQIKVIFPESLEAAFGGASLHRQLEAAFKRHGISVLYNIPIHEITPDEVLSTEGHRIKHDLLMLVPSFRGYAIFRSLGATDESDYIKVDGMMKVQGVEKMYALGDVVAFSGPKFAHMAVRQAEVAAENIVSEVKGKEPKAEYYHEINTIIDEGGADSIYLHYGIWDDNLHNLKKGRFWSWAKEVHEKYWQTRHK